MVARRIRANPKAKARSGSTMTPHKRRGLTLFGEPPLLPGESTADFYQLYDRIWEAVKPADTVEEMLLFDVACLEWEVLRWRRLKLSLVRSHAFAALQQFLSSKLDYDLYSKLFEAELANILENNLPDDGADDPAGLVHACALNDEPAVARVNQILDAAGLHLDSILDRAKRRKAGELVQAYFSGEPNAADLVGELLETAGRRIDQFLAEALDENLEYVEHVDRLANIAESRRNDSLLGIERRQIVFGQTLRQRVQQIEASELKVVATTPAKGKKAA